MRRKFKPLARSAKCFKNFIWQNFKILTKRNSKSRRSQILKFYRSEILKFRAAEFPLSLHKRYILKFRRSRGLKFNAASKPLQTSAVAHADQILKFRARRIASQIYTPQNFNRFSLRNLCRINRRGYIILNVIFHVRSKHGYNPTKL